MAMAVLEQSAAIAGSLRWHGQSELLMKSSRTGEHYGSRLPHHTGGVSLFRNGSKAQDLTGLLSLCRRSTVKALAAPAQAAPVSDPVLQEALKRAVAKKAVELVKPGMIVGLGTGSTSSMAIEELGKLISKGKLKDVIGVPTSYQSRVLARQFGVKTVDLNDVNHIDLAFDGADEVEASMNLIKGGGAAHTMEKVVDNMSGKCVILVDQTKVVSELGLSFPLPVEVLPYAISPVLRSLVALGGVPEIRSALRKDGPVITDLGNMVVDVRFPEGIKDPAALECSINMIPGVVENGLFIGIADSVLVATHDGEEITIVELAEFVKSLSTASQESAKT
ncbi:hypothetical protein O6H91_06G017600 [Diphasiastrum complanatum]|uniref:Uncharacterized protein n=1 Tax=Diphasiastrum complanatum TaxID=34168 RepID=A0ACC2DBA5_DIPCM|nr:hypothetical protein O6H91_06G017600 [Diphasiastrum complanatum]